MRLDHFQRSGHRRVEASSREIQHKLFNQVSIHVKPYWHQCTNIQSVAAALPLLAESGICKLRKFIRDNRPQIAQTYLR
jgi:hypothetical protein